MEQSVESLKARNFDIVCMMERLQMELRANNDAIAKLAQPVSNGTN